MTILNLEMDEVHHESLKTTSFVLEALKLILTLALNVLTILNPIVTKLNELTFLLTLQMISMIILKVKQLHTVEVHLQLLELSLLSI